MNYKIYSDGKLKILPIRYLEICNKTDRTITLLNEIEIEISGEYLNLKITIEPSQDDKKIK